MATRRSARARLTLATLGLALAAPAVVAGVDAAPASAERTRVMQDRPWSGFRIDTDDRASGSWLGARKIGSSPGRVVYRIDPGAAPRPGGYRDVRFVSRVPGPGPRHAAGPRATARAAWILSKYGSYQYEIQSAAVDAAVLHLLTGGAHSLRGRASRARLGETGQAAQIKRFATIMLRDSVRRSGRHRAAVAQLGQAAVGDPVRLGVQVAVARSGAPLPSVPVAIKVDDGPWRPAGETDAAGRLVVDHLGAPAGPHRVTARVARVPEHRLLLMQPRRTAASRVALAGRKHVLGATTLAAVKARPRVAVTSRPMVSVGRTSGTFSVSEAYGADPALATVVLRGPFGSVAQATCERKALRVRRVTVTGNGRYPLPSLEVRQAGVYVWHLGVPGTAYNLDAGACGGTFRVRPRG